MLVVPGERVSIGGDRFLWTLRLLVKATDTYLSNGKQYGYGNVRQPFSYAAQIRNIGVRRRQHPAR
jgi:hypothetical protein